MDEINFIVVDGNNEIIKGGMNTNESRIKSGRNASFMRGSFYSNADIMGLPLPNQLKINQEILTLIVNGQTQAAIDMFKKLKCKEIVGIRGLSQQIDDLEFETDTIDT